MTGTRERYRHADGATTRPGNEGTGPFVVELERFRGPLDLLLHLIRTQDIDILDIPIARITDQFLGAVDGLAADDLDGAGEFLEMAATLVHIKAQMLLPRPTDEEDDDPRAELVRRLLEYEQVREVTERLRSAEGQRARRFGKGYVPVRRTPPVSEEPLRTTWEEVWDAALGVEMPERGRREHHVTPRTVSMEEKAALILDVLRSEAGVRFHHLLRGFEERMHGVMTLLAGLELTRRRLLILRQSRPFTELWIYRSDREGAWEEPGAPPEPGATADETPSTREGAEG